MEGKGEKPSVCEREKEKKLCSAPPTRAAHVNNKLLMTQFLLHVHAMCG